MREGIIPPWAVLIALAVVVEMVLIVVLVVLLVVVVALSAVVVSMKQRLGFATFANFT